jgi:hypothetical protein
MESSDSEDHQEDRLRERMEGLSSKRLQILIKHASAVLKARQSELKRKGEEPPAKRART